ncbi:Peroxisomal membrane signal receptor PTS1 [Saxophila tyrrhenica]|uniref:Peroxisomal targeting signal receptor n=1 Tax=Saxophila tyrrhenica TaxID=1690608 RepID=A0AAV9PQ00_9PEZI|nr:Peroxisomal membrane signal receptor PTS1 [Saxophila tyrrhenica]
MSFLSGPECSTGSNPLSQFQKQTSADTSLQRDRLTSRGPQQLNGFRSQQGVPDDAAFQDFAHAGPQMPTEALPHFEQMRREQEFANRSGGATPNWAGEFAQQPPPAGFAPEEFAAQQQQQRAGGFSPQDFANFRAQQGQARTATPPFQQQQPSSMYQRPMYGGGGFGMQRPMMYGQGMGMGQQPQESYTGKGKGRVQELSDTDWEKQFEELSTQDKEQDLDKEAEEAMERELNQMDSGFGNFEDIWNGIRQETNASRDMLAEDELANHFGDDIYDQWKDFEGQFGETRANDYGRGPADGNYMFEENNVFKDVPNAFEEGQKILREGGNLSLAALAFESAVQREPEFVDAWVALGQAQAQNEKEAPAIRALEQALKLDPDNLDSLMGLSVSYTNEGYDSLAYRTLERWVGVRYPSLGVKPRGLGEDEEMGFTDRHILHEKVTNLFLEAAQMNPDGENVDVDVQVGLGVLFYGSEDYDKAVDCFTAALNSAQHGVMKREGEEHLLWNRLGATLANSGRSEEAIEAYSRALELKSNFVRARYNLGVSCINLGVQEEAAVHLLGALSMHRVMEVEGVQRAKEFMKDSQGNDIPDDVVQGMLQQNQSTNLYDTLRRVFTQMNRRDLAEMVGTDMNLDAFRSEFEF